MKAGATKPPKSKDQGSNYTVGRTTDGLIFIVCAKYDTGVIVISKTPMHWNCRVSRLTVLLYFIVTNSCRM